MRKPKTFKILDGYSFPPFGHPYDCADTIHTQCYKDISLDDCINLCDESDECDAGYYLERASSFGDNNNSYNNSYCFPLRTDVDKESDPVMNIKPKQDYGLNDNVDATVFINQDVYPYPPDTANMVYYQDTILLKNVERDLQLSTTSREEDFIFFEKEVRIPLRLEKRNTYDKNIVVNYGDEIAINLKDTNLLLSQELGKDSINWNELLSGMIADQALFTIDPINKKDRGKPLVYGDQFYLKYNKYSYIILGRWNNIDFVWDSPTRLRSKRVPFTFTFIPLDSGYYCNNGICDTVNLSTMEREGEKGRIRGNVVYRSDFCFNQCERKEKIKGENLNQKKEKDLFYESLEDFTFFLFLIGFILLLFSLLYRIKELKGI